MEAVEGALREAVLWTKLLIEATGALIVAVGFVVAVVQLVRTNLLHHDARFSSVRLTLARYLALALEFQLGADILTTAVSPTWNQIGKLAAIAVIRTALNYFLTLEMRDEESAVKHV